MSMLHDMRRLGRAACNCKLLVLTQAASRALPNLPMGYCLEYMHFYFRAHVDCEGGMRAVDGRFLQL